MLYEKLLNLCNDSKFDGTFFFTDQELDGQVYRIFNYRLGGWLVFQENPEALEARGIMFNITNESEPVLVCRPMQKFFNYAEGNVNHEINVLYDVHEKLDGSLISSYFHNRELKLKTKGSIKSEQAINAMAWLAKDENALLRGYIHGKTLLNKTVNLEWTSPTNRIVVGYQKDALRVLSVRDNETGELELPTLFDGIPSARQHSYSYIGELHNLIEQMYSETVGEGYVLSFIRESTGKMYQVKVKNHKYCNLHKIKDSISNPEALAELIIRGQSDDVIQAFENDEITVNLILEQEKKIIPVFNEIVKDIEAFYEVNKHLDRKSFAIKATEERLQYMSVLMMLYTGRKVSYEDFAVKNMTKLFGVKNQLRKQY